MNSQTSILGAFDHAFVINLDRAPQRFQLADKRLRAVGITAERFAAIVVQEKGPYVSLGARGCTESHAACVRLARERGYERVLIFEDDVIFRPHFPWLWKRLLPNVSRSSYDLFYFYDWHQLSFLPFPLKLRSIKGTYCNHAYVVHRRYYDRMLSLLKANETIGKTVDEIFNSSNAEILAPNYNLAGQDAGMSDLTDENKDRRWSAHSKSYYRISLRV